MALRLLVTSLVLIGSAAGTGRADDDALMQAERQRVWQEKRTEAEQIETAALRSGDPAKYVECGEAYLAIYNVDRENAQNDEVLFNAGVCFAEAKSIGAAIHAFALVRTLYPRRRLAVKATAREAMLYADTAYFERAAELFEEYAIKYAGEDDANIALGEAVYYYQALRNPKWIQLTKVFIKTYGAKRPEAAATAYFALHAAYDGDVDGQIKHLRDFIRTFGGRDPDRLLLAHAKLGDLIWAKACPVKMTNGLCVKQVRTRPAKRCGKSAVVEDVVVPRDEKLVKEAMVAYQAALKVHAQVGRKASPEATYAAVMAMTTVADRELEAIAALQLPKGLELGAPDEAVRVRSQKRFASWLETQQKAGAAVLAKYQEVLARREPSVALVAMQRMAQTTEVVWAQLDAAELPTQQGEAYCAALRDVAEPLRLRTKEAYGACAAKAAELLLYPPAAEVCLQALERFEPELYRPMKEQVALPVAAGTVLAVEPPITHAPW